MVAMTMAITTAEPIISRLDRLDYMLRQLEEIRGCNNNIKRSSMSTSSPKTSCASSTASSGTLTSDGHVSSLDVISPKSLEKHCRPIEHVMMETDAKGTLIERLDHVEDRVLKLCLQLEVESEAAERKREQEIKTHEKEVILEKSHNNKKKKGGLKQLVKQCVTGKGKPNKIK